VSLVLQKFKILITTKLNLNVKESFERKDSQQTISPAVFFNSSSPGLIKTHPSRDWLKFVTGLIITRPSRDWLKFVTGLNITPSSPRLIKIRHGTDHNSVFPELIMTCPSGDWLKFVTGLIITPSSRDWSWLVLPATD